MGARRADLVKAETAVVPQTVVPQTVVPPQMPAPLAEDILATPPDARDITAELAAPPRRRLPWLTLCLAAGIVAAGAFSGGVWYERDHGTTGGAGRLPSAAAGGFGQLRSGARANGQQGAGGFGQGTGQAAGGQGQGQGQGQGRSGSSTTMTAGTVKVVDGDSVYLTDAQGNTVKITTGGSTKVQLSKSGKVSDLKPGDTVVVQGTQDSSGNVAASQVTEGSGTSGGLTGRFGGFGGGGLGGGGFGGGGFGGGGGGGQGATGG